MSRKTLALLVSLLVVTVVLLGLALSSGKKTAPVTPPTDTTTGPQPTDAAQTTLTMTPATVTVGPNGTGTIDVTIATEVNDVSAVQLELEYEPTVITNVVVKPGTFFDNPLNLLNTNDQKTGRISYALGVTDKQAAHKGTGTVATITFRKVPTTTAQTTELKFLPKTIVTAISVSPSVLKTMTGATINLGQ